MQKVVFVLVLFVFIFGTAIGLGFLMEKYELVAFLLGILGVAVCSTAVGAVLLWALEPTVEEDESQEEPQLTKREE